MTSALRTRPARSKRRRLYEDKPTLEPYFQIDPIERQRGTLFVPDPITFATGKKWLNRTLYPRQATVLKVIFLRDDLLTDFDYEVIAEWEQNFRDSGSNGTPPGLIQRIQILKKERKEAQDLYGYFDPKGWFRELVLVLGRRAGKGYVCALAFSYVLYRYMSSWDPQARYGIDRDKQMECIIYAGRKEQARDNLWRDIINVIQGAPCFQKHISRALGESMTLKSPKDLKDDAEHGNRGSLDDATFKIVPRPATPMSGRGGASFAIGMDEMAHMIATGANRSSDEVWLAAKPSLDQFSIDAFIMCPSSPWEMIGQFYQEWKHAQEIEDVLDEDTGAPTGERRLVYPEIFMLQLASWEIYIDWQKTLIDDEHPGLDMFPTDTGWDGDLNEYADGNYPKFEPLFRPIQAYDTKLKREERSDPQGFAVERRAQWQATQMAYLDPKKIVEMFAPLPGSDGELHELQMVTSGALGTYYKAHGDPGFINDNFGFAVAHTVTDSEGYLHVVFDLLHQWEPIDFPEHTVDLIQVTDEIWDYTKGFPLDDLSFDQHQSMHFFAELNKRVRETKMPKRPQIHIINETAPYNLKVAQTFKAALNQGWIHCFAGETEYLTPEGPKSLRNTAGTKQMVLDSSSEWVEADIKSFGEQPLRKITLKRNGVEKILYATGGHRWFTIDNGQPNLTRYRKERVTDELQPGMRLAWMKKRSRLGKVTPSAVGIQAGIVYGDGTANRRGSWVDLNGDKDAQLLKWFPLQPTAVIPVEEGHPSRLRVKELPKYFKDKPPLAESAGYLYGWLAGYFAADGTVTPKGQVTIASSDRSSIDHVQRVCDVLGIGYGSVTQKQAGGFAGSGVGYELTLGRSALTEDFFLIDSHRRRFLAHQTTRDFMSWRVVSVEESDRIEEVYCAVVPGTASFTLVDHILTGNCPYLEAAELQLKFLKFENGKVTHQTAGPVQHDDLARAMFEVVFHHLERQVSGFLMEGLSLSASMAGGHTPWMHPQSGAEKEAIDGLRSAVRRPRGGGGFASPARGARNPGVSRGFGGGRGRFGR